MYISKDVVKQIIEVFYDSNEEYENHKKEMIKDGYNLDKKLNLVDGGDAARYTKPIVNKHNKCKYCNIELDNHHGKEFGKDNILQIVKYGDKYMLRHDVDWYDDSYDVESEIDFCPKCGRKLNK